MLMFSDTLTALGDFVVILNRHPFGAAMFVALAWAIRAWGRKDKNDGP